MGLVVSTRQTLRLSKRRLSRRLARKLTREPVVSRYYAGNSYDWMATLGEVKGWTERRISVIYARNRCGPAILPRFRVKFFNSSSVNWKLCEINLSRSNVNTVFRRLIRVDIRARSIRSGKEAVVAGSCMQTVGADSSLSRAFGEIRRFPLKFRCQGGPWREEEEEEGGGSLRFIAYLHIFTESPRRFIKFNVFTRVGVPRTLRRHFIPLNFRDKDFQLPPPGRQLESS